MFDLSLLRFFIQYRLNGLRWVKSESLDPVNQVTQLDLRDNCLDSLDLSSVCNLETLHCQRNQLETLTLSGFTLRMLHAGSNRESNTALTHCSYCPTLSLRLSVFSNITLKWRSHIKLKNCLDVSVVWCAYFPTGLTTVNIYPVPNQLTHMDLSQWVLTGKNLSDLWKETLLSKISILFLLHFKNCNTSQCSCENFSYLIYNFKRETEWNQVIPVNLNFTYKHILKFEESAQILLKLQSKWKK